MKAKQVFLNSRQRSLLLVVASAWVAFACTPMRTIHQAGSSQGAGSGLTSVDMTVPDPESIDANKGKQFLTHVMFQLDEIVCIDGSTQDSPNFIFDDPAQDAAANQDSSNSGPASCQKVDGKPEYLSIASQGLKLPQITLKQTGHYFVTLSLGSLDANKNMIKYYSGSEEIKSEALKGKSSLRVNMVVKLTNDGKKVGLPATASSNGTSTPQNLTQPPVGGSNSLPPIKPELAKAVVQKQGRNVNIGELFQKELLIIEIGTNWCGPCQNFARGMETKINELNSVLNNGKCDLVSVVNNDDFYKANSENYAKHVVMKPRQNDPSHVDFSSLSLKVPSYPHYFILDRSGKEIKSGMPSAGTFISDISSYCKK